MKIRVACVNIVFGFLSLMLTHAVAVDLGPHQALIPRNLLPLVHARETHRELQLSDVQVAGLERLFSEIDSRWFASRNLPQDQQIAIVQTLEDRVRDWFAANTRAPQQARLQQLEYYSQSGRMLLRSDLAGQIGLEPVHQAKLAELARKVQAAEQELRQAKPDDPNVDALQAALKDAIQAERAGLTEIVPAPQRQRLNTLLGKPFDASKLQRIYPMAPEFVAVEHWINTSPLRMSELRGKVVLVHFYAFQCHNCHANFGIYQRWHKELRDKGVVVVGIQTPETDRERDPGAVRSAARDRELNFPILVDLKSDNWRAWGNTMWPTVYVVDKNGYIRHWWQGELNWKGATSDKVIENLVDRLLAEDA